MSIKFNIFNLIFCNEQNQIEKKKITRILIIYWII